jgi:potassium-dependent mechanosensitive channel
MTRRLRAEAAIWVAAWALLRIAAAGAEGLKPAPADATAKVEIIVPADIALRADVDERFLRGVARRAAQPGPGKALEERLAGIAAGIGGLEDRLRDVNLTALPTGSLESLDRHWRFYERQITDWRDRLQSRTQPYSDDAAGLALRRAAWVATRDAPGTASLAPALHDQIPFMIAETDRVDRAVSGPLGELIALGRKGNVQQSRIEAWERAVAVAIQFQDRRLWLLDSPPLWASRDAIAGVQDVAGNVLAGIGIERAFVEEYAVSSPERAGSYVVVGLFLLPLLLWLDRRARRVVADAPELADSLKALLRPVSAWVALCLLGSIVLDPDAPVLRHHLAWIAALIPTLRLLPRQVFDRFGPGPYLVAALYVANGVGILFYQQAFALRIHVLAMGVATLATVCWLLFRSRRLADDRQDTLVRLSVRGLGWLAIVVLSGAAIGNLVGNVSLAIMLTSATLDSACHGLVLIATAAVLGSVLKLFLSRRHASQAFYVARHAGPLLQATGRLIWSAALLIWLMMTLAVFRILRPVTGWLREMLTYQIEAGAVTVTIGGIALFVAAVYLAMWVARVVRLLLAEDVLPRMSLPRGVDNSIATLSYYALIMLGLLAALAVVGFKVSELAFIFGALGVGIGFGLQGVVNNFVSGLILMFERPVKPGDVVEVGGTTGTVREIGIRATTVRTFEGAEVVVPNGALLSDKLVNWTLTDRNRRLDVAVGVAYGSDPRRVIELLLAVVRDTPGVLQHPEPVVFFAEFGASSLDFILRAWTSDFDNSVRIRSDLTVRVYEALKAAGIEIPFAQQDLHLRTVSREAAATLAASGAPRTTGG